MVLHLTSNHQLAARVLVSKLIVFHGPFFFISGYFLPGSFDRHNVGTYVSEKFFRLGIPLLLGIFVIVPYEMYFWHMYQGDTTSFIPYYIHDYLGIGDRAATIKGPFTPELNLGHLWYIEHLLVYSLLYAVIRVVAKKKNQKPPLPFRLHGKFFCLLLLELLGGFRTFLDSLSTNGACF